jgi:hypothetical protein
VPLAHQGVKEWAINGHLVDSIVARADVRAPRDRLASGVIEMIIDPRWRCDPKAAPRELAARGAVDNVLRWVCGSCNSAAIRA